MHERHSILVESHGHVVGVHYVGKAITHKILGAGLWWPTLHKDSKEYCSACDVCERIGRLSRRDELSLNPQVTLQDFDKWASKFYGTINPLRKNTSAWYFITATNYLTRWSEAKPIKDYNTDTTAQFIFEYILLRFRCPKISMTHWGSHLLHSAIEALMKEF